MSELNDRLRKLRTNANLTQKQVAERMGISVAVLSSYETGSRKPSNMMLIKFANLYRTTTDYLLGRKNEKTIVLDGLSDDDIRIITEMVDRLQNK